MPKERFLIEEILKDMIQLDDDNPINNLTFIPYPSEEAIASDKKIREIKYSNTEIKPSNTHSKIFIGQLPAAIELSAIVLILEKITQQNLVSAYYRKKDEQSGLSIYGFLLVPNDKVNLLTGYTHLLRPDKNGIWCPINQPGIKLLKNIATEIYRCKNLQEKYNLEYDYCKLFALNNIVIEKSQKPQLYSGFRFTNIQQEKYLIDEVLKARQIIINNQLVINDLSFYPYPSPYEISSENRQYKKKPRLQNHTDILIGQLPKFKSLAEIILIIEQIYQSKFIVHFSEKKKPNIPNTKEYGFITIPDGTVSSITILNKALRPDRNGVWVANTLYGLEILESITYEIAHNPNISNLYGTNYNYSDEFSKFGITVEVGKNQRKHNNENSSLLMLRFNPLVSCPLPKDTAQTQAQETSVSIENKKPSSLALAFSP